MMMFQELKKFAIFIIRSFTEIAQKNHKAYMELLFWKTTLQANEMVEGYDTQPTNKKVSRAVWSEEEEDELRTLFMEHQTNKYPQGIVSSFLYRLYTREEKSPRRSTNEKRIVSFPHTVTFFHKTNFFIGFILFSSSLSLSFSLSFFLSFFFFFDISPILSP